MHEHDWLCARGSVEIFCKNYATRTKCLKDDYFAFRLVFTHTDNFFHKDDIRVLAAAKSQQSQVGEAAMNLGAR